MARSRLGVLLIASLALAVPMAAAESTTDAADDVLGSRLSEPATQPAVDIIQVDGTRDGGRLSLAIQVNGTLPIGQQAGGVNDTRRFTYLFIVAIDKPEEQDLYTHLQNGGEAITAICRFHAGLSDLDCQISLGEATIVGRGANQANVTLVLDIDFESSFELGAWSHESLGPASEEDNRSIIAQDFTDNALPYDAGERPDFGDDGAFVPNRPDEETPWYKTPWPYIVGALAVVAVVAWVRTRPE